MSQTTIIAIFFSFIFSLSTDNPWIYSEFTAPSNPINYAFSIGTGSAESYISGSSMNEMPDNSLNSLKVTKKLPKGALYVKNKQKRIDLTWNH